MAFIKIESYTIQRVQIVELFYENRRSVFLENYMIFA